MTEFINSGEWWRIIIAVIATLAIRKSIEAVKESKDPDRITRKVLKVIGQKICDIINFDFKVKIDMHEEQDSEKIQAYLSFSFKKTKEAAIFTFFPRDCRTNEAYTYMSHTIPMPLGLSRDEMKTFLEKSSNDLLEAFHITAADWRGQKF